MGSVPEEPQAPGRKGGREAREAHGSETGLL